MQRLVVMDKALAQNGAVLVLLPKHTKKIQVQCRDATAIMMAHRKENVDSATPTDYFTIKASTVWTEDMDVGSSEDVGIYLSCASASKVAEIACVVEDESAGQ